MIQVVPQMRILVAVEAVDFRKGIDGLARVCKEALQADVFSGCLFVFCNRRKTGHKNFGVWRKWILALPKAALDRTIPFLAGS